MWRDSENQQLDAYLPLLVNSANISVNSVSSWRVSEHNGSANNAFRCVAGEITR